MLTLEEIRGPKKRKTERGKGAGLTISSTTGTTSSTAAAFPEGPDLGSSTATFVEGLDFKGSLTAEVSEGSDIDCLTTTLAEGPASGSLGAADLERVGSGCLAIATSEGPDLAFSTATFPEGPDSNEAKTIPSTPALGGLSGIEQGSTSR